MIISKTEASTTQRAHIRDNLQARSPIGCTLFSEQVKKGVFAIGVSPDGHSIAILTKRYQVIIHDKISEKTFIVDPISIDFMSSNTVTMESLLNLDSNPGEPPKDRFSIYVSNNCTNIFIMSDSERLVATWSEAFVKSRAQKAAMLP